MHRKRKQIFDDWADAIRCIKKGETVRRLKAKDGSIPTHPVVEVPPLDEATVLRQCIAWLRGRKIVCNRHDVGAGDFGNGYATYGIKGGGDIIGLLSNGIHFEIECKNGKGGRLSKWQQKRMRDIRDSNGYYFVVHGLAELEYYWNVYCLG